MLEFARQGHIGSRKRAVGGALGAAVARRENVQQRGFLLHLLIVGQRFGAVEPLDAYAVGVVLNGYAEAA